MLYAIITQFLVLCVSLFYKIRVIGHQLPNEGPAILVANHPNGLLDPLVLLTQTYPEKQMRFLAKEPLFRMPIVGTLLKLSKALPVYRRQDGYQGEDNRSSFQAVEDALQNREWICLFPEGISYHAPRLQPFKTGAARMALGAESQSNFQLSVQIIPVGLHFVDKGKFRSSTVVTIGEPLVVGPDWQERYEKNERQAARDLTQAIEQSIKDVTVNLESWSDLPLLDLAGQVYEQCDPEWKSSDPVANLQFLAQAYASFHQQVPTEIEEIRYELFQFGATLSRFGIKVSDLEHKPSLARIMIFILRQVITFVVGLPFTLIGLVLFFIPYHIIKLIAYLKSFELDIVATVKLMAGIVLYGSWGAGLSIYVGMTYGLKWGICTIALYPLLGLHTLLFLENQSQAWTNLTLMIKLLTLRSPTKLLLKERDLIYSKLSALQDLYSSQHQSVNNLEVDTNTNKQVAGLND